MFATKSDKIEKKIGPILGKVVSLGNQNIGSDSAADEAADFLLSHCPLNEILYHLPACQLNDYFVSSVILTLLRSPKFAEDYVRQLRITGFNLSAFNIMVELIDDDSRNMKPLVRGQLVDSLRGLLQQSHGITHLISLPSLTQFGNTVFDLMVDVGHDHQQIIKSMNPLNIVSAARALNKYGYEIPIITSTWVHGGLSLYTEFEQYQTIYNVLKISTNPLHAHTEIDSYTNQEMTFHNEKEMEGYLGDGIVEFLDKASYGEHIKLYDTMLKRAVVLLRQEGALQRLNVLSKASMAKLINADYLNMNDLDHIPNGIKWFGRNKLSHDLGI